ncbi:MAG TPA: amidase [Chloroflexota bacterium]|nr:amidase [Chloroflexota bacterium]
MADLWQLPAAELLERYASHDLSPVEVVADTFQRIERLNPRLRAYLALNQDEALAAARAAEQAWLEPGKKPPLCGVPVSVKDTIEMAGQPTTYGSLAFRDNRRPDSEIVRRLRQAGAIILGKTNTPEFALLGETRNRLGAPGANPWSPEHTCGGSSGGAAAAVAAGLGPLAVGTDSGGSIRLPAAYTGIFGLKPTYQRIPAVQMWRASPNRSHNGPLTRTVRDTALLMGTLAGPDARDPSSLNLPPVQDWLAFSDGQLRGVRVALSHDFGYAPKPDAEVLSALDEAAGLLESFGCDIVQSHPPSLEPKDELEPGVWAYSGDHYAAAEAMIPAFWDRHADDLTDYIRPVYDAGRRALAWQYRLILRRNQGYVAQMQEWFRSFDFLLSPVSGPAPQLDAPRQRFEGQREHGYLVAFNIAQNPAASVPFGFHSSGLPLAVQIVGKLGDDLGVLRLAAFIEAQRPWAEHWPELAL